jgi:hypothetical protein
MNVVRVMHKCQEFESYMHGLSEGMLLRLPIEHVSGMRGVFIRKSSAGAMIDAEKSLIVSYVHHEVGLGCMVEVRCFISASEKPLLRSNLEKDGFLVFEGQTMLTADTSPPMSGV